MVAGFLVFVGCFVVGLPVFGIGWNEADPKNHEILLWRVPTWLGIVSFSGFGVGCLGALVNNYYE
jgi:hypothetical protein